MLMEANDLRQEGVTWIIKNLWNLGQDILLSKFPPIFDAESISLILDLAKSDIKLQHLIDELSEAK